MTSHQDVDEQGIGTGVVRHYAARLTELRDWKNRFDRQDVWFSRARGLAFLVGVTLILLARFGEWYPTFSYTLGTVVLIGFVALVEWHERMLTRRDETIERCRINEAQMARNRRDWDHVPWDSVLIPDEHAAVANDLDLFGRASLYQLVGLANTPNGIETLRDWLLVPAWPDEVVDRQQAVQSLTPKWQLREELNLRGRMVAASLKGPDAFVEWAEGAGWFAARAWVRWLVRGLTALMLVSSFLWFSGIGPRETGFLVFGLLPLNALLSVAFTGQIHDIFNTVSSRSNEVRQYRRLFELFVSLPDDCDRLTQLKRRLGPDSREPLRRLRRIEQIMILANARHSSAFGILHLMLQIAFLWDFHLLELLERWQLRYGKDVRPWFEALGELEALASLATLAYDNQDWAYPKARTGETRMVAESLGHPLLDSATRVVNDVELGPSGTFLLITGSNMSGKSTLLRAVGLNIVLAQAGAPICGKSLRMPPMQLATSMRIKDSLEDGVSYFMAELKRLKQIVDLSAAYRERGCVLCYLLDEILQGTNSSERHIAVCRVIGHLLENGAIGAVSTHDVELAQSEELASACQPVHFRETFRDSSHGGKEMTFDYKMRPGLATTTNALKLLELVGLDDPA